MKWLLLPFALIYRSVAVVRNWFFDLGVLKSKAYNEPVIVLGNITVGGTGKTPHVEYLLRLLKGERRVAVVSRGYGRSTNGFIKVTSDSDARSVGDEPLQIKRKFPVVLVAVDEVRTHAIDRLLTENAADTFILDDAFQHRHVKAGLNIVLVDYNRPIFSDLMLPAGRLREPRRGINRADIVLVTKCPQTLTDVEKQVFSSRLKIKPEVPVFFTTFEYGRPTPLTGSPTDVELNGADVVAATGIAQPARLYQYLQGCGASLSTVEFADHHFFTTADADRIRQTFEGIHSDHRLVIVTEKDAARFSPELLARLAGLPVYSLPIEVKFLSGADRFDALVRDFCGCTHSA